MLTIDPWCYLYWAILVLMLPVQWLLAAIGAAAFHETCHVIAILMMGQTIHGIDIKPWGVTISASFSGKGKEMLAALAGPLGSFCLLPLCHVYPALSLCALAQGGFNLIPLYPLDGGRMLRCCMELLVPESADKICRFVGLLVIGILLFFLSSLPTVFLLTMFFGLLLRKIPCNADGNRVQ